MRPVIRASAAAPAPSAAAAAFKPAKPTLFSVPVSNKAAQVREWERGRGCGNQAQCVLCV